MKEVSEQDEPRFAEEALAAENAMRRAGVPQPTFTELKRTAEKFGTDGVLEAAVHLPPEQYEKLEAIVKRLGPPQKHWDARKRRYIYE